MNYCFKYLLFSIYEKYEECFVDNYVKLIVIFWIFQIYDRFLYRCNEINFWVYCC